MKIEEKMIAMLVDAKTTLEEAAKLLVRDYPSLASNIVNECAIRCGYVVAEARAEKTTGVEDAVPDDCQVLRWNDDEDKQRWETVPVSSPEAATGGPTSEIERMREMIRELANMLCKSLTFDMNATALHERFDAVERARAYLSGPAYDFADPAAAREERNTGSSTE